MKASRHPDGVALVLTLAELTTLYGALARLVDWAGDRHGDHIDRSIHHEELAKRVRGGRVKHTRLAGRHRRSARDYADAAQDAKDMLGAIRSVVDESCTLAPEPR